MRQRLTRMIPILLVALIAFAAGTALVNGPYTPLSSGAQNQRTTVHAAAGSALLGDPYLIADIAERVIPAVVFIEVEYPARSSARNPFNDPFFRDFFWPFFPWPDQGPQRSRGTGFIIDEEYGYILTNQHVVGDPGGDQKVTVKLHIDGFEGVVPAKILGSDYELDLAVLQIEKPEGVEKFPALPLGDSDASRPGEWVIAIGNPYGEQLESTVTVGVLSAKGRQINIYDRERGRSKTYKNLMQTDAAINPGNSGGPLLNIRGEVIGINTAVNAQAQGIGFAIPINTALEVKDQLITDGRVTREPQRGPFLGVNLAPVDERIARSLNLSQAKGALIVGIVQNSPAQRAGLRVYDVIERFGETEIDDPETLVEAVGAMKPGDEVLMVVVRQGRRFAVPVVLADRADFEP